MKSASSPTGPLSSALTDDVGAADPLVVSTPAIDSNVPRACAAAPTRSERTTLVGSVVVRSTSARELRTRDGWSATADAAPTSSRADRTSLPSSQISARTRLPSISRSATKGAVSPLD